MDLKKVLGNMGCTALGTILPPFGGMAANLIRGVLGLDDDATAEEIVTAVNNATPEQMLALKEANNEFVITMKKLDIDVIALDQEDTKNARGFANKMGIKTVRSLAFSNTLLVVIVVVGVGFLAYSGRLANITAIEASLITLAVREVFAKQEQVYNFFFGSSHGSKQKTKIMGGK